MIMSKAYADYLQSLALGWTHADAVEYACKRYNVEGSDLLAYIAEFEGGV